MRRKKISKRALDWVKRRVHEYDVTLTKIIPRDIERGSDTVREEIFHLMFNRECLHNDFQKYDAVGELFPLWQRMQKLDALLVVRREMILTGYPVEYYRSQRERLKMPKAYWWWYLDELESAELPVYNDGRSIEDIKGVENLQVQAGNQN
ncbi:hypothetical protein HYR99_13530 [Candidatus Poribacteria bacterium]|nr:hypothetical protein [Candidatus Poribacteria bacterium]